MEGVERGGKDIEGQGRRIWKKLEGHGRRWKEVDEGGRRLMKVEVDKGNQRKW